jgi:hypothetical protein
VSRIVVRLERRVKLELRRMRRETKDKALAVRCQIVLLAARDRRRGDIAESVGCSVSWVNRVVARFAESGVTGLLDRREDNGQVKLDEWYLADWWTKALRTTATAARPGRGSFWPRSCSPSPA